jgi:hypothetical protein
MRKTAWIVLFQIIAILVVTSSWAQTTGGPRMVFKEKAHNVGEVEEGAVIEHAFTLTNQGDKPLLIKDVKPG